MDFLSIAQYMASAAFFTIAVTHLSVWTRVPGERLHGLFAAAAAAAGANAIAEELMYSSSSIAAMSTALRWYVMTSGCWAIATVCFLATYANVGRLGWILTTAIVCIYVWALSMNWFSPASFLYTELTGLREIVLPWGETIQLAIGKNNPWRLIVEFAWLAIMGVAADGSYRLWLRKQRTRAILFGTSVFVFMACFGTHAFLVDTRQMDSPYLSTYGFLTIVGLMSFELAGEVLRTSQLSSALKRKDTELKVAVVEERSRIARDLHDSVTQTLFSTAAIADALPDVWARKPVEALRGLDDLKTMTKGALSEMRMLLLELRPAALTEKPFGELLQQLATSTIGRNRIPVDVEIEGQLELPNEVQVALYRTAQEALNNIVKHSDASHVSVRLSHNDSRVSLAISDNGRGFETTEKSHAGMGLEIMSERLQAIGGILDIETTPRGGTTVKASWSEVVGK